jgi:hypothetical protein
LFQNGKTLTAKDDDSGSNGKIEYSIKRPQDGTKSYIYINKDTGELTIIQSLDREDPNETGFTITIRAADKGQPSLEGYCAFQVTVLDENDNLPFFLQTDVAYTMNTNTPIGPVFRVYAIDRDEGSNAKVSYFMKEKDNNCDFSVDKDTGFVVLNTGITTVSLCYTVETWSATTTVTRPPHQDDQISQVQNGFLFNFH